MDGTTNNLIKIGQRSLIDIFQRRHTAGQQAHENMFNITNYAARYHLTLSEWPLPKRQEILSVGKGVEKRGHSYIVGGNVNWYSHYGQTWKFLKKLNIELPNDLAIPPLGIYAEKAMVQKDACTIYITALFTIAKKRKQTKCPLMEEQIMKM